MKAKEPQLNSQQRQALERISGATLLLAVPGSGKTTVIIERIGRMIRQEGIDPRQILTLTFSKAGARDLRRRYNQRFGDEDEPQFSTIHSFAYQVVKQAWRRGSLGRRTLLTENSRVLRRLYREVYQSYPGESDINDVETWTTKAKNLMLSRDEIAAMDTGDLDFLRIYEAYEDYKQAEGLLDFDDMLADALQVLNTDEALYRALSKRFCYLNIDEAQDTSKLQFAIIHRLAAAQGNLFMVGDEDQSIYGFRGAFPQELLRFKEVYPAGEVLLMETNYRTTGAIVAAADRFITINETQRYAKHMVTDNPTGLPAVHEFVPNREAQYVHITQAALKEGKEIAVLYRNNESAVPLVDLCERRGVAYRIKEHNALFFSHYTTLDIACFLRLALDPTRIEDFDKIYTKISCNISRENFRRFRTLYRDGEDVFEALLKTPGFPDWLVEKIEIRREDFEALATMAPGRGLNYIMTEMGYREHLEYRIARGASAELLNLKIGIIRVLAQREETIPDFLSRLAYLQEKLSAGGSTGSHALTFSTIHSAKGLEFQKVFIIDAVEGQFPPPAPAPEDEGEVQAYAEEVRLFYVAATRAKQELVFLSIGKEGKADYRFPVSSFINYFLGADLPAEKRKKREKKKKKRAAPSVGDKLRVKPSAPGAAALAQVDISGYIVGTQLNHQRFGRGTINGLHGDVAQIEFENCGTKRLNLRVCVLGQLVRRL